LQQISADSSLGWLSSLFQADRLSVSYYRFGGFKV